MFCTPIISRLLNCITETIQVTEGRIYFRGPHVGQPWSMHCRPIQPVARGQHVRDTVSRVI